MRQTVTGAQIKLIYEKNKWRGFFRNYLFGYHLHESENPGRFPIELGMTKRDSPSGERTLRLRFITNQQGFTLIEMLIAVAMTLLVLSGVYEVFNSQQNAYNIQDQVAEMQQNARVAMDIMTREIKMAGYDPEETGWTPFSSGNTDSDTIQFYCDLNPDSDNPPEDTDEDITFDFVSGESTIKRTSGVGGTAQPIAENISALSFTYYDSSGVVTGTFSDVRLIKISLTARTAREDSGFLTGLDIDGDASNGTCRTRTLTAYVRPRNLGL